MKTSKPNTLKRKLNTKPTSNADVECKRCQQPFRPAWIDILKRFAEHCETCQVRNIFDGLDMMTPPDLIDRHSKLPALTDAEFKRSLERTTKSNQP